MSLKASELRAKLKKGGLGAEDAERIVAAEVNIFKSTGGAKGVENDGAAGMFPMQALIDAAEAIKAINAPDDTVHAGSAIQKGGAALGSDVADMLRSTVSNTENLTEFITGSLPELIKGVHTLISTAESLIGVVTQQDAIIKGMDARLAKGGRPTGVNPTTQHLPAPGDERPAGSGKPGINRDALKELLRKRQKDLIQKGGNAEEIEHIGKAIGACENTFAPAEHIIKHFDIEVSA